MLVITAEIWPGGDKTRKHLIGEMRIANESNLAEVSSYSAIILQDADAASGAAVWQFELLIHGRRRSDGAWALVRAVLDQALPKATDNESSAEECASDA
jgi:hypothetical protein